MQFTDKLEPIRAGEGALGSYDLPELPPSPPGPLELLPSEVAAGLHDLRNEVKEAQRDIQGVLDGPPEEVDATNARCANIGYTALKLAARLRRHYRLGSYQAAGVSTFASELRRHYRMSHRGPLRKFWHSLPVYKNRRRISRGRFELREVLRRQRRRPLISMVRSNPIRHGKDRRPRAS